MCWPARIWTVRVTADEARARPAGAVLDEPNLDENTSRISRQSTGSPSANLHAAELRPNKPQPGDKTHVVSWFDRPRFSAACND